MQVDIAVSSKQCVTPFIKHGQELYNALRHLTGRVYLLRRDAI
jgi:hypothetical protein